MLSLVGVQPEHRVGQDRVGVVEVRVGEEQGRVCKAEDRDGVSGQQGALARPQAPRQARSQTRGRTDGR